MLVSLTVGKVDAGVAVLLTEDKRLVRAHQPQCFSSWCLYSLRADPRADRVPVHTAASGYLVW